MVTGEIGKELYANFSKVVEKYELLEGLDNLIYLFSGGKDATTGLDFLQRYKMIKVLLLHWK
jgi:tRNA(Ile)-lysidine synthase TilS/MesJ